MCPSPNRSFETAAGTVSVFPDSRSACAAAAVHVMGVINERGKKESPAVLGLSTGSTPKQIYAELAAAHAAGAVSFRNVVTFNLDEYYPISPFDPNSYRRYMHEHLFSKVDLAPNQAHLLDGTVPIAHVEDHCAAYERWIADFGLDVQLLGIGRNGHIGFNEPASLPVEQALRLKTRLVELHPTTSADAARDFGGKIEQVPRHALSMGISTILSAASILMVAFGAAKASAVAQALNGPVTAMLPASLLQTHQGTRLWFIDEAAAGELER